MLFMTLPRRELFTTLPPGLRGQERSYRFTIWSTPTTSLLQEHSEFTEDPQVNFTSICNSSSLKTLNVPSTVQIVDLEEDNPMTDDKTTMTETNDKAASLPCLHAASLPCSQAASLPCLQAAELTASDADAAEVAEAKQLLLSHSLPKARQRTNVFKDIEGETTWGFATRGEGITQASFRFPEIASAMHLLASTRPSGFAT